ncbi:MAG: hypothetical protein QXX87_04940, partial [Candidatus Jordarchaeales archaeon]
AIRKIMEEVVKRKAEQLNYGEFAQEAVLGKIASEIYNLAKKIVPLRKCEIWKTKPIKARAKIGEVSQVEEAQVAT